MELSAKSRALLKEFEGFREHAYQPVPNDKWTIGYGFTEGVEPGQRMTRAQADARLTKELKKYEIAVESACTVPPNKNQFSAMTILAWNIGISGFRKSTVLKAHNRGDFQSAARAFGLWNKSSGVVYPGLTRRRAAESALYLEPMPGEEGEPADDPMPQSIDAETPMRTSTINKASVIAGTTTAVATGAQVVNTFADMGDSVTRAGDSVAKLWTFQGLLPVVLGVMVVCLCGYIVWMRFSQRRTGWV